MTAYELHRLVEVPLQECGRVELVASQQHMVAEGEPAPAAGRVEIVGEEDRLPVIGVDGDRVVVGSSESCFADAPAFVSSPTEERADRSCASSSSSTKRTYATAEAADFTASMSSSVRLGNAARISSVLLPASR